MAPPPCGGFTRKPAATASSAWVNVKPSVVRGNAILADPAIAGVFYAFVQDGTDNPADSHLLKSTDFGQTWSQQDTMTLAGNAWGAAIDPDPKRCVGKAPCPPPVLYRAAGTAALGLWKSTDDGKTWTNLFAQHTTGTVPTPGGGTVTYPGQKNGPNDVLDFYQVLIVPDDPPNHLLVTYHYGNIVLESKDGGATWEVHTMIDGTSHYLHAFDAQTWIVMGQQFDAPSATYRTTTGGRVGGVPSKAAWTKVDDTTHCHGGFTPFIDPVDCSFTMAGSDGIKRTTDQGATWTQLSAQNACTLVGTPNTLHASMLFNTWGGRFDLRAPSSAPVTYTFPTPWDGAPPYGAASAFDAAHQQWVLLMTQYGGGIWRLTEPQ